MDAKIVAKNFVTTNAYIANSTLRKAFTSNAVEKNVQEKLREEHIELNALRLLVLTQRITETEYAQKAKVVETEIDRLTSLLNS